MIKFSGTAANAPTLTPVLSYLPDSGPGASVIIQQPIAYPMMTPGRTFTNLAVNLPNGAVAVGGSLTVTLVVNGIDTALSVTYANPGTPGGIQESLGSVAVPAGQPYDLKCTAVGTGADIDVVASLGTSP